MKFNDTQRAILAHFSPGFGGTEIPDWIYKYLENGLGGVTLFSSNCPSLEVARELILKIKAIAPNIIVSLDEEGGDVTRLFVPEGSPFPTPALLGRCNDLGLTESSFRELGKVLKSIGVDLNLAPVADVATQSNNPIVAVRSFGSDADLVAKHVVSAIKGLRSAGIASCIKHFPGHGGVLEDSHHHLPKLTGEIHELTKTHLKPFISAIEDGVEAIMMGHILLSAVDSISSASCSSKITRELLRKDLGFDGLVVTDALDMGALGGTKKIHMSALRAISAGADLLCFSGLYDQSTFVENSLATISQAIEKEEISSQSIKENAKRLWSWSTPAIKDFSPVSLPEASRFTSGVHCQGNLLIPTDQVSLIELSADPTIAAGFVGWGLRRPLVRAGIKVKLESSDIDLSANNQDCLVVAFRDAFRDNKVLVALDRINRSRPDAIFVDMGWPTWGFNPKNIIRTFGSSALASEIAVAFLKESPNGSKR
jgi:beta-N-acetylhexosaminidase